MAKCKNCKRLDNIMNNGKSVGKWCTAKSDSPDIERERSCEHYEPMSNADRIRSLTDQQLADEMLKFTDVCEQINFCHNDQMCNDTLDRGELIEKEMCKKCLMNWLGKEVNT
jgi:hypothetical protein